MNYTTILIIVAVAVILKNLVPKLVKFGEPDKAPNKSEWHYKVRFAKLNKELYDQSNSEEREELLYYYTQKLRQKDNYGEASFQEMPKLLQVVYLIDELEMEVQNGSLLQFFTNSSGQYAQETLEALELLGDAEAKQLLEEAVEIINEHSGLMEITKTKLEGMHLHTIFKTSDLYDNESLMEAMNALDNKFYDLKSSYSKLKMVYFEKHKEELWKKLNQN
ncbi:DMP19 family protein [Flagellimonas flava]|uniref:DMP19 family protein n=1 Tax=Flagellimonas flava TaxID=570519 RepID=UPI003D6586F8